MATITDIQTFPLETQQPNLNSSKVQSEPLQTLSSSGRSLNDLPRPGAQNVVTTPETWNHPRVNIWRLAAVFFAFINFGMNDACYGALIPYVRIVDTKYVKHSQLMAVTD